MNTYKGNHNGQDVWYEITLNDKFFDPAPSLKHVNHSPDGFSFGYSGSGCAQFAFGILLNETDDETAHEFYMQFKNEVVSRLHDGFVLTSEDVAKWVYNTRHPSI